MAGAQANLGGAEAPLPAVLLVAEQLARLPVDEMQPGAGRAREALVVLALVAVPIRRLQQGLHLKGRYRAVVNDEPFHGSILWSAGQYAMRQARASEAVDS